MTDLANRPMIETKTELGIISEALGCQPSILPQQDFPVARNRDRKFLRTLFRPVVNGFNYLTLLELDAENHPYFDLYTEPQWDDSAERLGKMRRLSSFVVEQVAVTRELIEEQVQEIRDVGGLFKARK